MGITAKAVLKANRLFRDLPDATVDKLASLAIRRAVKKGTRIFAQGDPGDSLMGLIAGQVRISANTATGQEVFLNIMEPGDSFGEIGVLDGDRRTAGAVALTACELFVIRRRDLLDMIERDPKLAAHLIALLCRRLRWTSELIEEAAFLSAHTRLARRLVRLSDEHGTATPDGVLLRLSQAELAGFMSVSRQIVNQYLQDWRRRGWITIGRGKVTIRDANALRGVTDLPD